MIENKLELLKQHKKEMLDDITSVNLEIDMTQFSKNALQIELNQRIAVTNTSIKEYEDEINILTEKRYLIEEDITETDNQIIDLEQAK